jgi:hypothetical protein
MIDKRKFYIMRDGLRANLQIQVGIVIVCAYIMVWCLVAAAKDYFEGDWVNLVINVAITVWNGRNMWTNYHRANDYRELLRDLHQLWRDAQNPLSQPLARNAATVTDAERLAKAMKGKFK